MQVRKAIHVSGMVQGVGFRPYVYRLATERSLAGSICNSSAGVAIEIQGPAELVEEFISRLPEEAPALAQITDLRVRELSCNHDHCFQILPSLVEEAVRVLISPDTAICDDCLRELFDPADRRYLYPFINCTNCGPRFTIVQDIPYDRPRTSMAVFHLCDACRQEYEDALNRRFHAQPNACRECGPHLQLWDAQGERMDIADPVTEAAARLQNGEIVAIKGLGGFHLAADATNPAAIRLLRQRKCRAEKPFAVMVPDLEVAAKLCEVTTAAQEVLSSRARPIVLLPRKPACPVAEEVAPHHSDLGLLLPYAPVHYLLFAAGKFAALVMTSGNLSEEPIAIENREAARRLAGVADSFLVHDREILFRCDDSVVRPAAGRVRQIRRSRGYVPAPVTLHKSVLPVLAVGGELKCTICLTRENLAFLSQHIGDLENPESFAFFGEAIAHFSRILEIKPKVIAHDLHPDYFSTRWALAQKSVPLVGVQHHHAHIASCMAENGIEGRVIGLAMDGTGYGTDGNIWGGEALVADFTGFERAGHLAHVPMPGGAAAIREPWRMAVSYLAHHFGEQFLDLDIPFVRHIEHSKVDILLRMIERQVNSPLTSSCGRLFDAVAALLGLREQVSYEGQAAMELEALARSSSDGGCYSCDILQRERSWEIGTQPLFEALIRDILRHEPVQAISRRFHTGLVRTFVALAGMLRQEFSLHRVCLSGGTFQNALLLEHLICDLESEGFDVFTHSGVPAGDGGLSLGQALVAAHTAPAS